MFKTSSTKTSSAMSQQRLTDLSFLEDLGMGDDDLLIEMIEMFLQNTPESLKQIQDYTEQKNWKKVAAEAHKLKPNLSYMGLERARDIIVDIEKTAKNDPDKNRIEHNITKVETICRQAYQELRQELNTLKT
ncbi:MAG: Hpt domain-containing protein [Balneolaceae bacterium]|nr:Hpt domain-containing protein [Balneolaceae bacterium]